MRCRKWTGILIMVGVLSILLTTGAAALTVNRFPADTDGYSISEYRYDYYARNVEIINHVLVASKDGKSGLLDMSGHWILPCEYTDITKANFENRDITVGYIGLEKDGLHGLADPYGNLVLPCQYSKVSVMSDTLFRVSTGSEHSIINNQGEEILSPTAYGTNLVGKVSEGLICYGSYGYPDYVGYIDETGNNVIPRQFEDAGNFHNGIAIVALKNEHVSGRSFALIDKQGNILREFESANSNAYTFGFPALNNATTDIVYRYDEGGEGTVTLTTVNGDITPSGIYKSYIRKIGDSYHYSGDFISGTLAVSKDGKIGLFTKDGEVLPCIYDELAFENCYVFSEYGWRIFSVKKDGKWGALLYDGTNFREFLPCTFDSNSDFYIHEYGVIDVTMPQGDETGDQKYALLFNRNGEITSEPLLRAGLTVHGSTMENRIITYSEPSYERQTPTYVMRTISQAEMIIDETGTPITNNIFKQTRDYKEDLGILSAVASSGAHGIIDRNGNTVVPFEYEYISFIYQGPLVGEKNDKWGVFAKNSYAFTPVPYSDYDSLINYQNGVFVLLKQYKPDTVPNPWVSTEQEAAHGVYDSYKRVCAVALDGRVLLPFTYSSIWFEEGFPDYLFADDGIHTKDGALALPVYKFHGLIPNGNCLIQVEDGKWAVIPATKTAAPNASKVTVNGKEVAFNAYTIEGNNYFKLRDLASVLSGSGKQFDVSWDGGKNAINLLSGEAYTPVGGELAAGATGGQTGTSNTASIYLDGTAVVLTAYTINGNNYFKLRDLGQVFDFGVAWSGAANTISIDTTMSYTPDK